MFCNSGEIIPLVRYRTKLHYLSLVMRKRLLACAKTKTQISFAVTVKLISAFVFATRIVQSLYLLNAKFQASSHLVWLHSPVSVRPGRKPGRPVFSQRGSLRKACSSRVPNTLSSLCCLTAGNFCTQDTSKKSSVNTMMHCTLKVSISLYLQVCWCEYVAHIQDWANGNNSSTA